MEDVLIPVNTVSLSQMQEWYNINADVHKFKQNYKYNKGRRFDQISYNQIRDRFYERYLQDMQKVKFEPKPFRFYKIGGLEYPTYTSKIVGQIIHKTTIQLKNLIRDAKVPSTGLTNSYNYRLYLAQHIISIKLCYRLFSIQRGNRIRPVFTSTLLNDFQTIQKQLMDKTLPIIYL